MPIGRSVKPADWIHFLLRACRDRPLADSRLACTGPVKLRHLRARRVDRRPGGCAVAGVRRVGGVFRHGASGQIPSAPPDLARAFAQDVQARGGLSPQDFVGCLFQRALRGRPLTPVCRSVVLMCKLREALAHLTQRGSWSQGPMDCTSRLALLVSICRSCEAFPPSSRLLPVRGYGRGHDGTLPQLCPAIRVEERRKAEQLFDFGFRGRLWRLGTGLALIIQEHDRGSRHTGREAGNTLRFRGGPPLPCPPCDAGQSCELLALRGADGLCIKDRERLGVFKQLKGIHEVDHGFFALSAAFGRDRRWEDVGPVARYTADGRQLPAKRLQQRQDPDAIPATAADRTPPEVERSQERKARHAIHFSELRDAVIPEVDFLEGQEPVEPNAAAEAAAAQLEHPDGTNALRCHSEHGSQPNVATQIKVNQVRAEAKRRGERTERIPSEKQRRHMRRQANGRVEGLEAAVGDLQLPQRPPLPCYRRRHAGRHAGQQGDGLAWIRGSRQEILRGPAVLTRAPHLSRAPQERVCQGHDRRTAQGDPLQLCSQRQQLVNPIDGDSLENQVLQGREDAQRKRRLLCAVSVGARRALALSGSVLVPAAGEKRQSPGASAGGAERARRAARASPLLLQTHVRHEQQLPLDSPDQARIQRCRVGLRLPLGIAKSPAAEGRRIGRKSKTLLRRHAQGATFALHPLEHLPKHRLAISNKQRRLRRFRAAATEARQHAFERALPRPTPPAASPAALLALFDSSTR
eukprot:scaffold1220_cov259-Pinguiococcus_pyrenoidosus.AAC.10